MTSFLTFKPSAHRAAIAGKVSDALSKRPVAGALASITEGPPAYGRWLALQAAQAPQKSSNARAAAAAQRPDQARTAADGCFCFVDLPDGDYTVSIGGAGYGTSEIRPSVKRDLHGSIPLQIAAILLPPTGVRGAVIAGDTAAALPLARVRAEGSRQLSYCDAGGAFYLGGADLEHGARRLVISAAGYSAATVTAQIVAGQVFDLGTITLNSAEA